MLHNKEYVIRQWIFEEINKPIIVEKWYPHIQFNEFEYEFPFKEGGLPGWDRLGIMASTIYNDTLFYEYYVLERQFVDMKSEIMEKIMKHIDDSISNYKINYG